MFIHFPCPFRRRRLIWILFRIHKAKYMDDEDAPPKPQAEDKKSRARSKSRSRAMFGKK